MKSLKRDGKLRKTGLMSFLAGTLDRKRSGQQFKDMVRERWEK